ncbi:hypothetical protein GYB59_05575 [bacterium]|nr:hypothetical protein [bacterium]
MFCLLMADGFSEECRLSALLEAILYVKANDRIVTSRTTPELPARISNFSPVCRIFDLKMAINEKPGKLEQAATVS